MSVWSANSENIGAMQAGSMAFLLVFSILGIWRTVYSPIGPETNSPGVSLVNDKTGVAGNSHSIIQHTFSGSHLGKKVSQMVI